MKSLLGNKLYDWLTTACQLIVLGFLFLFTSIPLITSGASLTALYHCISLEFASISSQSIPPNSHFSVIFQADSLNAALVSLH